MTPCQNRTLLEINFVLEGLKLRPLKSVGDRSLGQPELLDINEIRGLTSTLFTDIIFDVRWPDGRLGWYCIRFNAHGNAGNGCVFVTIVNQELVALVRQYRPPLGDYVVEVPRGFRDLDDGSEFGTVVRELREEVTDADIESCVHLGDIAEMTGTHNVYSSHYLVHVSVPQSQLHDFMAGTERGLNTLLWTRPQVISEYGKAICDNHSLASLNLAFTNIDACKA